MLARRKFLQVFGVGAASAPLAAKAASDQAIQNLVGISQTVIPTTSIGAEARFSDSPDDWHNQMDNAASWLRAGKALPDAVLEPLRREAEYIDGFDVDIASKKSWSMAAKVQEQRIRNLDRKIKSFETGSYKTVRAAAEKALGFKWPF